MEISKGYLSLSRFPHPKDPGYVVQTFTDAMQKQYLSQYNSKYPVEHPTGEVPAHSEKFSPPRGYSDSYDHFHNFVNAVRTRQPVVEDGVFGLRDSGAALLSNLSIECRSMVEWNPETMQLAKA